MPLVERDELRAAGLDGDYLLAVRSFSYLNVASLSVVISNSASQQTWRKA